MAATHSSLLRFPVLRKLVGAWAMCVLLIGCASTAYSGKEGVNRAPDKALIHAQLARGYMKQKQYAIAKSELDEALRIQSDHSDSNYVMALLMIELKQYDQVEQYFSTAVRSDPENAAAAHDFGLFLCQTNKERESVRYFDIAANNPLFGKRELSYMRAGECLSRIDDPSAEKYLKHALTANPQLRPALYRLAEIKYTQSAYLIARAYIERYFAITKPQPSALLLAYKIELKLNANEMAESYRTMLLEDFPGSEQASTLRRQ